MKGYLNEKREEEDQIKARSWERKWRGWGTERRKEERAEWENVSLTHPKAQLIIQPTDPEISCRVTTSNTWCRNFLKFCCAENSQKLVKLRIKIAQKGWKFIITIRCGYFALELCLNWNLFQSVKCSQHVVLTLQERRQRPHTSAVRTRSTCVTSSAGSPPNDARRDVKISRNYWLPWKNTQISVI